MRLVVASAIAPRRTRRMLVLQTLPPSGEPDLDLDDKLQAEKGAIVSWALQADRAEVKRMLTMGDKAGLLESSALQAEVQMDPIRNFIDQCLMAKPTDHKVVWLHIPMNQPGQMDGLDCIQHLQTYEYHDITNRRYPKVPKRT